MNSLLDWRILGGIYQSVIVLSVIRTLFISINVAFLDILVNKVVSFFNLRLINSKVLMRAHWWRAIGLSTLRDCGQATVLHMTMLTVCRSIYCGSFRWILLGQLSFTWGLSLTDCLCVLLLFLMILRVCYLRCSSDLGSRLDNRGAWLGCSLSLGYLGLWLLNPIESVLRFAHTNDLAVFSIRCSHCRGCSRCKAPIRLLNWCILLAMGATTLTHLHFGRSRFWGCSGCHQSGSSSRLMQISAACCCKSLFGHHARRRNTFPWWTASSCRLTLIWRLSRCGLMLLIDGFWVEVEDLVNLSVFLSIGILERRCRLMIR